MFQNNEAHRGQVMAMLTQICNQGHDLSVNPIQTPWFQTFTHWLDSKTLLNVPLSHQVEELDWANNALTLIHKLVNDVEVIVEMQPETPQNPIDSAPNPA